MMPGMMGFGGGGLFMLVFWVIVVGALVVAARSVWPRGVSRHGEEPGESALEILRRRYARGEIDREEFEARKRDLG